VIATEELEDIELELLLQGVARVYGYDFREYAEPSLKRRMSRWLRMSGFSSYGEALPQLLRDPAAFEVLLGAITINFSTMFRDPAVFRALREQVTLHLKTYPFVKIWVAGCAGGEEAYSMAILLEEEGLSGRYRIYATDLDPQALAKAREGIFPLKDMQLFTGNYQKSGARSSFSDYYTACYGHAILMPSLREHIVFAAHNLAGDSAFGEMQLILCRNVLIYFRQPLKERALELFHSCLADGGFLCLGSKETLNGRPLAPWYREIAPHTRLYRKQFGSPAPALCQPQRRSE
jgi:chemotaxis protein methyltransferase CheR